MGCNLLQVGCVGKVFWRVFYDEGVLKGVKHLPPKNTFPVTLCIYSVGRCFERCFKGSRRSCFGVPPSYRGHQLKHLPLPRRKACI
jgi:hypothetical protein